MLSKCNLRDNGLSKQIIADAVATIFQIVALSEPSQIVVVCSGIETLGGLARASDFLCDVRVFLRICLIREFSLSACIIMEASHAMIVTVTCVVLSWVSLAVYSEAVTRTGREQTAQALTLTGNLLERTHKLLLSPRTRRHALVSRWPRQFGRQAYHEKTRAVTKERVKRAPVSDSETKEYRSFHIDVSNCGTEKSCVRFGPPDCGMTECLYMLTFQKIGDVAEFELSAKTPGWVAVGFSSDNKMGGDEVISCIHNIVPYKISASTMMNVIPHEKPRPKPVPLNLTGSEYRNGFISCRVRRDMAAEGGMDLTNDWFQLYAWGNVGSTGGMMRHDWDKPPTSAQSYSIIQRNINDIRPVNGKAARHPVCVLLTAFCCFVKLMLV